MPNTGYIHGSDLILSVAGTALGHSKTCSIKNAAETKSRATKETSNSGKWQEKTVTTLSVSITAEGFSFYGDTLGYPELLALWKAGEAVAVKYAHRGEETTKYRSGNFIITNLEENAPADDDATYSISLENSGEVTEVEVGGN